jgi:vacuolar-type H+-ATPase subunit H
MDMMYLVDRLEALVNQSRRVPLSSRVMLEEEEVLAIVEKLRESIPQEIKQARKVLQDRDQILKAAQAEAEKTITMARERAEYMINQEGVLFLAKERGEQVLNDAQRDAQQTRQEIEQYAVDVLSNLEQQLQLQLHQVRNGLQELNGNHFNRP